MLPRSIRLIILSVLLVGVSGSLYQFNAQVTVDLSYNGVPSLPIPIQNSGLQQAIQADGKLLVWGGSLAAEGAAKGKLLRLNADGSLDNGFTYCHCVLDALTNAFPLPDGKILVAGSTQGASKVIRLNNDGSLDSSFNNTNPPNPIGGSSARLITIQSDGKFYTTRSQAFQGFGESTIFRFNADGSIDGGFTPIQVGSGTPNPTVLVAMVIAPDGKIYVGKTSFSFSTIGSLTRRNSDGTADSSWTNPNFQPNTNWSIGGLALQADGALIVSGDFSEVNGVSKTDLVRILPAGNVDLGFSAPSFLAGGQVSVLANGNILLSARTDISGIVRIFRLTSNGTPDGAFAMAPQISSQLNSFSLDASERIVFLGSVGDTARLVRLNVDGSLDNSFNPNVGIFGRVFALARQNDGKVIIAGEFDRFNGVPRVSIVRTNVDGSIDPTFDAGSGFNSPPRRLAVQSDNKIIAVGSFGSYNGNNAPGIIRLMPDGSIDPGFVVTPNAGAQFAGLDLLADGRVMVSGNFSTINGTPRAGVARLHTDGTVDNGFNALVGGSPSISVVLAQPDGKVMLGGSFSGVGGFNRANLVRLESSGALDQTFTATVPTVGGLWLGPGGKYLIGGVGGDSVTITRRNNDGSPDAGFAAPTFVADNSDSRIYAALPQADGSIIIGGNFYTAGATARKGLVRLTPNGSLDPLFLPRSTDGRVRALLDAGSAKVMIGGDFSRVESTTKAGLARLNVTPFRKVAPYDFDGDGRSDFSVFRPSTNEWYILRTSDWAVVQTTFGLAGDVVAPADFDGDGKTDLGIFRPSSGDWWYAASTQGGAHRTAHHGMNGDIPRPSDFDGDGKADMIVYRPSNGIWYRLLSNGSVSSIPFGAAGDQPLIGDFDGDGKSDPAIFRPSAGEWWYAASSTNYQHRAAHWGQTGDVPAPADYDGDGKTDLAVFRPSEGGWYVLRSSNLSYFALTFGLNGDRPIPGDYDGDGSVDIAVFRPSSGLWYLLQTTSGFGALQWGVSTDVAIPNAFVPQ